MPECGRSPEPEGRHRKRRVDGGRKAPGPNLSNARLLPHPPGGNGLPSEAGMLALMQAAFLEISISTRIVATYGGMTWNCSASGGVPACGVAIDRIAAQSSL